MAGLLGLLRPWRTLRSFALFALFSFAIILALKARISSPFLDHLQHKVFGTLHSEWAPSPPPIDEIVSEWVDKPPSGTFESQSIEVGHRAKTIRGWLQHQDSQPRAGDHNLQSEMIEKAAISLFPFLSQATKPEFSKPLENLRSSFRKTGRGIVLSASVSNFRQTFHLIGVLREGLQTTLPIQVVHSGNDGLRSFQREMLAHRFPNVSFLDIYTVIDDSYFDSDVSQLPLRAVACLATTFEKFILLSEGMILLKRPDDLFEETTYRRNGFVVYQDRISPSKIVEKQGQQQELSGAHRSSEWSNEWLHAEMKDRHRQDVSVAIVDKSRYEVLFGLLHATWQCIQRGSGDGDSGSVNMRESETWRLAFELTGAASYKVQTPSDAVIGGPRHDDAGQEVCSFAHGFADGRGRLLWYISSMLASDRPNSGANLDTPSHRMPAVLALSELSENKIICRVKKEAQTLTSREKQIIQDSITKAQQLDDEFKLVKMHRSLTSSE